MRFRRYLALALPLISLSFGGLARAEEPLRSPADISTPQPAPVDLPPPGARTNLIIGGIATSAVAYGLALSTSLLVEEKDFRGAKDLRIPFAGPWMALSKAGCPTSNTDCSKAPLVLGAILTIFDGVAQAGGLGLIGEGLFMRTSARRAPQKAEGPTVRAVPLNFEKGGVGLGVFGTF